MTLDLPGESRAAGLFLVVVINSNTLPNARMVV